MTHAIVTGAGGFVGGAVVEQLTKAGTEVTQWTQPLDALACHGGSADVVVHLASSPRHTEIAAGTRPDVAGTQVVLAYCRAQGASCVLASTAGVYRGDTAEPQHEDAPVGPANAYAAAKLAAEECCRDSAARFGISCAILRLFNIYGPGQRPPFLVPTVVEAVLAGKPVELRRPDDVRDFVFVEDVARAFVAAVNWRGSGATVINIGSGQGTRVRDLVTMVAELVGKSPDWTLVQDSSIEVQSSVADIERARVELGWRPTVEFETGLRAFCDRPYLTPAPRVT